MPNLKETVLIEFIKPYPINKVGSFITFLSYIVLVFFTYKTFTGKFNMGELALRISIWLFILIFGISLKEFKKFQKGKLHFVPEGIIIESNIGFTPIKYDEIKSFHYHQKYFEEKFDEFSVKTHDKRKFIIKANEEIYEGLSLLFPDKTSDFYKYRYNKNK